MDEVHETSLVILRNEAELTVGNLLVCGDIDHVVGVTVTVHVISQDIRSVVTAAPGLIDQAIVVAALIVDRSIGNDTVGSHIL